MKQQNNRFLFSAVGVLIVLAIVIAVNFIARNIPGSADLTEDNVHTLSEGTKKILDKVDTPVSLKLYVTGDAEIMPPQLAIRAREVEAFLTDYVRSSDGMITLEKYDPEPDTDEEDAAKLAGIQATPGPRGQFYFGLTISCLDQKIPIAYLPGLQEQLLEYEVSRAISQVSHPEKITVAVASVYSVAGGAGNPFAGRQDPPWIFYSELGRDFDVIDIGNDFDTIEDDVKVLLLLHPGELSPVSQYAVDQFLLRGGKVAAFLDAHSITAQVTQPQPNPMMRGQQPEQTPRSSNMRTLLEKWGITFDASKVVADLTYKTPLTNGQEAPAVLTLPSGALNQEDVLTSQLNDLLLVFPGEFTGEPTGGLTKEVLLSSSASSQMVDPATAERDSQQIIANFEPSNASRVLALRLSGLFETAFPDGEPTPEESGEEEAKEEEKKPASLKKGEKEAAIVLVADSDLLYDQFCVRSQNFLGQTIHTPINGNLAFFQNIMELLSGDSDLIQIRSRGSLRRPFTRINEIEEAANAKIREQIKKLEDDRRDAENKVNELQAQKDDSQKFILTPEQQKEIEKFQEASVVASKERRKLQKQARSEYNSLIAKIKAANIFMMPILVALAGVIVYLIRRSKTSAR